MSAFTLVVLTLLRSFVFLYFGKIDAEAVLWSSSSGIFLLVIGIRKMIVQQTRTQRIKGQYSYWHK